MSFRDRAASTARALDEVLLGSLVQLSRGNRKILKAINEDSSDKYSDHPHLEHSLATLRSAREASMLRLQRIEDKAKGTVIGVGIGVTVIGSASAFLGKDSPLATSATAVKIPLALLLASSIGFLLISGYLALRSYKIGRVWMPSLDDVPPLVPEPEAKAVELHCISQNNRMGSVRANYLSVSFDCLRNGLVLLAVVALVFLTLSCTSVSSDSVQQQESARSGCYDHPRWQRR